MNNEKMSVLISELRKKQHMTQKQLAEKNVKTTLKYAGEATRSREGKIRKITGSLITGTALIGIVVCAICNIAINGAFTWSLYPIISIVFAWAIVIPIVIFSQRGILVSLILLSALLIPFLISIGILSGYQEEMNVIGVKSAVVGMIYIWGVYILQRIMKRKRLIASAISVLLVLPVNWLINGIVDSYTKMNGFDVWDIIICTVIVFIALTLIIASFHFNRRTMIE